MKILMVNKYYYIKGGSETYYFALKTLLQKNGHEVIDFSMKDEKNVPSEYEQFFVENIDFNSGGNLIFNIKAAGNIIYSMEAKRRFEQLVCCTKPDIVHLNLFQHQLSPSILDVIKKYKIPAVYTAHDLKMICLNYKMYRQGNVCESCKDQKYVACFKNKCVKDSYLKSFITVTEGFIHKWKNSYDVINTIITPSLFYRNKFIEFGIEPERIVHIPNFIAHSRPAIQPAHNSEQYFLYFGRLSEEKGIITLIRAVEHTELILYIVGTGPLQLTISRMLKEQKRKNIHYLGFLKGKELQNMIGNAKAVVIPSEWYENGPYSAIEALQLGRPVIGSKIGGIPELIINNGVLFQAGNVEDLRKKLLDFNALTNADYLKYSANSERIFENNHTQELYLKKIMNVYNSLTKK